MLSPADIEKKQFKTTRLKEGYDEDEVDSYLDECAAALKQCGDAKDSVLLDNETLRKRLEFVQKQLDSYGSQPTEVLEPVPAASVSKIPEYIGDVSRILTVAQQAADQQVAEAHGEAMRIMADATRQADEDKSKAQVEVYHMQTKLQDLRAQERDTRAFLTQKLSELQTKLEDSSVR